MYLLCCTVHYVYFYEGIVVKSIKFFILFSHKMLLFNQKSVREIIEVYSLLSCTYNGKQIYRRNPSNLEEPNA